MTSDEPAPDPYDDARVEIVRDDEPATDDPQADDEDVRGMVAQPAKVMRIGTMVKQLLDEVRSAPLDDAARARLAEIHERSLHELDRKSVV